MVGEYKVGPTFRNLLSGMLCDSSSVVVSLAVLLEIVDVHTSKQKS